MIVKLQLRNKKSASEIQNSLNLKGGRNGFTKTDEGFDFIMERLRRAEDEGFEKNMVSIPSSRNRARLHRSLAFRWVRIPTM